MIVRVLTEGQYEVDDGALERLQVLDQEAQAAIEAGDEATFHTRYRELLDGLRSAGTELADDDLRASDLMLPPPDVSFEEVKGDYSEHGLLPD
jgi:chromosome condensin MukBEF complex kleisin-like MukF subunit